MTIRSSAGESQAAVEDARSGLAGLRRALRHAGRRFTVRSTSIVMGLLGLSVLVAGTGYVAWNDHRTLFQEGRDHAEQSAAYLADHAQRLFEVADLVLHSSITTLDGHSWDEAEHSPEVLAGLRRMDDMLPYVDSIFAADATGRVRASTLERWPDNYSVADRSVFKQAAEQSDDRLLIGDAIVGRVSGRPTFLVAHRRNDAANRFDGIVGAAMTLAYFTDYWRALDKRNGETIALVRAGGGSVLVRYPDTGEGGERMGTRLVAAAAGGRRAGAFDPGPGQEGTFRQIGDLPIYIAVIFDDDAIAAQWHASLQQMAPPTGAALLALLAVMVLAERLSRREEVALRQIEKARAVLSANNRRLEERVAARTADLLETNREIQRFAYIVSHDLRAPLVNIMGFTAELQGLREEAIDAPPHDEAAKARLRADFDEAFGFINSSIDKMDRLIKAILALSRHGQRVMRPEVLDMDALMRSVADGLAHQAQEADATIAIGPLPSIVADRIAVEQVFANLADNAVKYLRPGVKGVIEISGTETAASATFVVKDNGRGIDPADRERVFDLFRRAGKQDRPGEGIGLANVRSLVRRLQGTITLDSTVGAGCVFTVTLPKAVTEPRE